METLLAIFVYSCRFSKGAFCRKSLISTGRNGLLKPGKLPSLIRDTGNKTGQVSIFREQHICQRHTFFIDLPSRWELTSDESRCAK